MNRRRKLITFLGGLPLALHPFAGARAVTAMETNEYLVDKYVRQNRSAALNIRDASRDEIVEESRRIAPLVSDTLAVMGDRLAAGKLTKLQLQHHILGMLGQYDLLPSMAGYNGFPAAVAISVDSELIHNVPDNSIISPGALVTVEIGASSYTAFASQAWSFVLPAGDGKKHALLRTAQVALSEAVGRVREGGHLGDISHNIQTVIEDGGFNVVREYCGYAMGAERILEPQILGYGEPGTGPLMKSGQILNIHVLATEGNGQVVRKRDGWGVKSKDGSNSVAVSAMVLVKSRGAELLSRIDI